ncbi:sulfotransferase family protein [Beggiatoa leptomitoformis]|uniref:Sulfotransferase n=1 Tax=Beggiatoa leptomitoformis TaxID=288004 RepID=A0A2N9YAK6_9GAMM|nr:sulfotransferase [Beggiatoa leptomitoformis]AUI67495.2 sulfotransferase [Beggiatoa leptomitoformis]QGX03549.1 sulfotransferase [Beggiatoa leptomitoformis]
MNNEPSFYKLPTTFDSRLFQADMIQHDFDILLTTLSQKAIPVDDWLTFTHHLQTLRERWINTIDIFGQRLEGELAYRDLVLRFHEQIAIFAKQWLLATEQTDADAIAVLDKLQHLCPVAITEIPKINKQFLERQRWKAKLKKMPTDIPYPVFERTIFIVSAPRSGSTLLYETLSQFKELWTINGESHDIIESIPTLHASYQHYESNCLYAEAATTEIIHALQQGFSRELQNAAGQYYLELPIEERPLTIRFLEKTPKNALRINFLKQAFPDALFIYLYRDPEENINSIMEGWRSRRFTAYRHLPLDWAYQEWSFLLPPHWRDLAGRALVDIAAYQWKASNDHIIQELLKLSPDSWRFIYYQDLLRHPQAIIQQLSHFMGLQWNTSIDDYVKKGLPLSKMTLSAPAPDKWRQNAEEILRVLPSLQTTREQIATIAKHSNALKP